MSRMQPILDDITYKYTKSAIDRFHRTYCPTAVTMDRAEEAVDAINKMVDDIHGKWRERELELQKQIRELNTRLLDLSERVHEQVQEPVTPEGNGDQMYLVVAHNPTDNSGDFVTMCNEDDEGANDEGANDEWEAFDFPTKASAMAFANTILVDNNKVMVARIIAETSKVLKEV